MGVAAWADAWATALLPQEFWARAVCGCGWQWNPEGHTRLDELMPRLRAEAQEHRREMEARGEDGHEPFADISWSVRL